MGSTFLLRQKQRVLKRLVYYQSLSGGGGSQKPIEYIVLKKRLIPRLQEALRRIELGLYGICRDCGTRITRRRLLAIPAAIYCRDCQELSEHNIT